MKKIVLIGQPNVGKSSLFNRVVKKRLAIVSGVSGTTRDIKSHEISILDKKAILIDTGGLSKSKNNIMEDKSEFKIFNNVKRKAIETAKNADIVLFMVDGKSSPDENDRDFFYELQTFNKKIILVINKIDNDKDKDMLWEFYQFGIDEKNMFSISVAHNRGIKKIFDWIYNVLPSNVEANTLVLDKSQDSIENFILKQEEKQEEIKKNINHIKVAIIGKVNVGKSSILNSLVGEERAVVSSIAGTTIDPVDETIKYNDKKITFIDTAGLRRRGKIDGIEKYALMRTNDMLSQANIAMVIIDASVPVSDQDEKIAGLVDKYALGTIIVLNKWDCVLENNAYNNTENIYKNKIGEIREKFKFLYYAPIIVVSTINQRNIDKLKDTLINIFDNFTQRINTSKINDVINRGIKRHSLPSPAGNRLKVYFSTQFKTSPPTIVLIMNKPHLLHFSYKRYLVNVLRKDLNFEGVPVHIIARGKNNDMITDEHVPEYTIF